MTSKFDYDAKIPWAFGSTLTGHVDWVMEHNIFAM